MVPGQLFRAYYYIIGVFGDSKTDGKMFYLNIVCILSIICVSIHGYDQGLAGDPKTKTAVQAVTKMQYRDGASKKVFALNAANFLPS